MRVRYITRSAGPEGCFQPGDTRELPDDKARVLISAGAVVSDEPQKYQTATVEPREELAVEVEPAPEPDKPRTARRRRKSK